MDLSYMDPRAKVHKRKERYRRDQQQHFQSLYHPTSLIFVEHRPIFHHTTLSHPHFWIENTTTPPLLRNISLQHPHNLSPFTRNLRPTNPPYTTSPRLIPTHQPIRLHIPPGSYSSHSYLSTLFSSYIPSHSTPKAPHLPSTTYKKPSRSHLSPPHLPNLTTTNFSF